MDWSITTSASLQFPPPTQFWWKTTHPKVRVRRMRSWSSFRSAGYLYALLTGRVCHSTKGLLELGCGSRTRSFAWRWRTYWLQLCCFLRYQVCANPAGRALVNLLVCIRATSCAVNLKGYNNNYESLSWGTVSAQGQLLEVICRATADCSDTFDLGVMSAEDCCVNTPDALGFSVGEICSPCIGECTE